MSIRAHLLALTILFLLAGCAVRPSVRRALVVSPHKASNVFRSKTGLPENIRRVAILPIPHSRADPNQAAGVDSLEPLFISELKKRNAFEVIQVSPEQLQTITGGSAWSADDRLPADFFERLSHATGCDAIIFVSLTSFHAYPPLHTGWKARLVDCKEHQTWWAVDEVFDAGSDPVAAAALAFANSEMNSPDSALDGAAVLRSPRRFGQYTANSIVSTLPGR